MAVNGKYIVGFIHVCMINNWLDLLEEQVEIMKESGLYNAVNVINVGCVGSEKELLALDVFTKDNGKLRIAVHSEDLTKYEYITLNFLKETVDRSPNFYGFYVHSKGVSWPQGTRGYEGGKYWRDYMNHFTLREWKKAFGHLELGYDTCGVKLVNKGWPLHYSGNFFWFNGEYVKRLLPVSRMNLKDRFNAEMWICSGQPIAATLSQQFVDYNTKGEFKP